MVVCHDLIKELELPSIEKNEKRSYQRPVLTQFGAITLLTAGAGGSLTDSCGEGIMGDGGCDD